MALQSENVVMVGLGLRADAPPLVEQPKLVDGVHLRWSIARARGFPWHGFFLYRRPSEQREITGCLLRGGIKGRTFPVGSTSFSSAAGDLTSPAPLVFTDDFPPSGTVEIDLRKRAFVRFDRPPGTNTRSFFVTIGFRERPSTVRCIDFSRLAVDVLQLPIRLEGVNITAVRGARASAPGRALLARPSNAPIDPRTKAADQRPALAVDGALHFQLPAEVPWVEVETSSTGADFSLEGLAASGKSIARKNVKGGTGERQTIRLSAAGLTNLSIAARKAPIWIYRLCYPLGGGGEETIEVDGLDVSPALGPGSPLVVARATASGKPGDIVTVQVSADRMTGVRVSGGNAAVLDICWIDAFQNALKGWRPLPKCPEPLTLPVRHPDYPAWIGPVSVADAQARALDRIHYGPKAIWENQPFADLHDQCIALVEGGPGSVPMDDVTRAKSAVPLDSPPPGLKVPALEQMHPLDLVMLAAVHRPIAEMIGLSWTDETADLVARYDYLIVADHAGVSGGSADKLLSYLELNGFGPGFDDDDVDGWIVFDQRIEVRPPFTPPDNVRAYALPGGQLRDQPEDPIERITGSAGLTWPRGFTPYGWLQPDAPVLHHIWRGDAGDNAAPNLPPTAQDWLTKNRPLIASVPGTPPVNPPSQPGNWPPFVLDFIDFRLDEGWWAYQVVGVDLFGRFSPKSPFAAWWQWAPEPTPRPWYYAGSSTDAVVNPSAVRILDKSRPPVPIGLAAFVLDPDDPIVVKDAAYTAWRNSLGAGGANTAGLRVRWSWTAAQQIQAPNVTEFRLYWSGGSAAPTSWVEPASWPDRFFVCPYNQNVTVGAGGERHYDVFLPVSGGTVFAAGVPLAPTLADPIAYANVSVTASDSVAHTADRWPGGGTFGGRVGNESQCAPPQRVFKVRRDKPPAPGPIIDSDKVYATPANWHGKSYHTFRWQPQPPLKTHVLRAIDEAVFEADWALQPRTIAAGDPAFPSAAAEPIWTNAKKTAIAGFLNAIPTLLGAAPTPVQKAGKKKSAFALYRKLTDDALRVLANRTGTEKAFTQVTVIALDAATSPDRRGPDDDAAYTPSNGRCAYVDEVDGRATNRLLYRAQFVDAAQNRSGLGACGTPVRLPNVAPPRAPAIVKTLGGDREITLTWASNRETDLLEYRVYRGETESDARDLRTMALIDSVAADPDPDARPGKVEWTDSPVMGRRDFWYRVVAVDTPDPDPRGGGGNGSEPSLPIRARAFDNSEPIPPAFTTIEWVQVNEAGTVFAYADPIPPGATREPAVRLVWPDAGAGVKLLVQVKADSDSNFNTASGWLAPGTTSFIHRGVVPAEPLTYRLKVINAVGTANSVFTPSTLAPPT